MAHGCGHYDLVLLPDECDGGSVSIRRDGVDYTLREMRCGYPDGVPRFAYHVPRPYRTPTRAIVPRGKRALAAIRGCAYCGACPTATSMTVDHVMPRKLGYAQRFNVLPACQPCNGDKGSLTLRQWYDRIVASGVDCPQIARIPYIIRTYGCDLLPQIVAEWPDLALLPCCPLVL